MLLTGFEEVFWAAGTLGCQGFKGSLKVCRSLGVTTVESLGFRSLRLFCRSLEFRGWGKGRKVLGQSGWLSGLGCQGSGLEVWFRVQPLPNMPDGNLLHGRMLPHSAYAGCVGLGTFQGLKAA